MAKAARRELPQDILFYNILPRLPVKSLPRSMLVSKQWHSFLKTSLFEKLHLHHATSDDHQNNLKFLIYSIDTDTFNAIDCEALDQDGLTLSRSFPFEVNSGHIQILVSFGGLVCFGIREHTASLLLSDLILWNPLTSDYKTLSKPHNSIKDCYNLYKQKALGLYYSFCDDDFKLLCVTHDLNAYIYSLKSDAWRMVDSAGGLKRIVAASLWPPYVWLWPSITRNEKLYFFKYGDNKTRCSIIIKFDTKTEKFTEIATPNFRWFTEIATPSLGNQYDVFLSLTVLRGCIHFFVIYLPKFDHEYYINSDLELQHVECWWMDEDGNWIKEVALPKASYIITEPLYLIGDWEIGGGRTWKLDLTRHVIKDISFTPDFLYAPAIGNYIETLVSPNRRRCNVRQPPYLDSF